MKINRIKLIESLDKVTPALATSDLVPVNQCFWIYGKHVTASDGTLTINASLPEDIDIKCAVPATQLLALLKSMTSETIMLDVDSTKGLFLVKSPRGAIKGKFTFMDYPSDVGMIKNPKIKKSENDFKGLLDGLRYCQYSVSKNGASGVYCGIHVNGKMLFSTDKSQISKYDTGEDIFVGELTLPIKFIKVLLKNEGNIDKIGMSTNNIVVVRLKDGTKIYSALLDGEYEDVGKYFPKNLKDGIELKFSHGLAEAIDRHIAFLKNIDSSVMFTNVEIQKKKCFLTSIDPELGELREVLDLDIDTEQAFTFDINPIFLREIADMTEVVSFVYKDGILLFEADELTYLCTESLLVKKQ